MTVEEAVEFFGDIPSIERKLRHDARRRPGLPALGQPPPRSRGGEAQRIKLAARAGQRGTATRLRPGRAHHGPALRRREQPARRAARGWSTRATRWSSSSTTWRSSRTPTTSSTWDPRAATRAAGWSPAAPGGGSRRKGILRRPGAAAAAGPVGLATSDGFVGPMQFSCPSPCRDRQVGLLRIRGPSPDGATACSHGRKPVEHGTQKEPSPCKGP